MKRFCFFAFLLVIITATAHAQDCAGGGVNAGGVCVPPDVAMPGNQQQVPQPPAQVWKNYWGAIYTDASKGVLGSATDTSTQESAEQAALADCQSKGGAQCKLQVSFRNGCAAMVLGSKVFNVNSAATLDEAVQKGMTMCAQAGDSCHVYYSTCSLPSRIQ